MSELHPYQPRGGDIELCVCGRWKDDPVHTEDPAAVAERDAEIRAFLARNPAAFGEFLRREMRRDPAWWAKQQRVQGLRQRSGRRS